MQIIPAIDIINNTCVRLERGDFEKKSIYNNSPLEQAKLFKTLGAMNLHLVNLDAAASIEWKNIDALQAICQIEGLEVQVGGGIRDKETIQYLFDLGVNRVVLGSLAVNNIELVQEFIQQFSSERICIALDVNFINNIPYVSIHGWQANTDFSLWELLDKYYSSGLKYLLCTDISRDGMLTSPNFALYQEVKMNFPSLFLQASGGVSSLDDLKRLRNIGVDSVIVGKALYEKRFSLSEALEC